jgi:hypothetical protein
VRLNSYDILVRFSSTYKLFNDDHFVNQVMLATALEQCNNPKAMMAEGAALLLKLVFNKAINYVSFVD